MSQIKKVSSVYIRLATPGTINTPKSSREDSRVHQKLVPSAPKSGSYPNRYGNRGTKGTVGTIPSAFSSADEDFPPPPPPAPANGRDAFHPSEMPLPPPPLLHPYERPVPSSIDSKLTRLQRPYVGGAPKQQEFSAPSESERHCIPSVGFKLEDSLAQTENKKPNGLPDSGSDICAVCNQLIPPTIPAINTMNKIFHEDCLKCRKCQCRLVGKTYYNLDGNPHCDSCYQNTMEKCGKCGKALMDQIIRAMDKAFHPQCFTCVVCHRLIGSERFGVNQANEIHCLEDFQRNVEFSYHLTQSRKGASH
uniref:filamin-binding LIM protein 1 isoform X2 n=1 Tax=Pristiophorus japonicus TaxID=55135 RepID=UPI00398E3518